MKRMLLVIAFLFFMTGSAWAFADVDCKPDPPKPPPPPPKKQHVIKPKAKAKSVSIANSSSSASVTNNVKVDVNASGADGGGNGGAISGELEVYDKGLVKLHDQPVNPDFQRFSGREGDNFAFANPPWSKRKTWTPAAVTRWRKGGEILLYPAQLLELRRPLKPTEKFDMVSRDDLRKSQDQYEWLGDGYLNSTDKFNLHDVWADAVPQLCKEGAEYVVVVALTVRDKTTGDTSSVGFGGGLAVVNNGKGQMGVSGGGGTGWSWGYAENVEIVKAQLSWYRNFKDTE